MREWNEVPRVSVILPVYNCEKFLLDAIESILNQTYSDFELLVIDDASTDGTRSILMGQSDHRIRVLRNERNRGIPFCRNLGVREAKGEYIFPMDADDVAVANRVEVQVQYLEENLNTYLVGSNVIIIDENGRELRQESFPQTNRDIMKTIFVHNPFVHSTVAIRATAFRECGLYDERFPMGEDYELFLRLASRYAVANLPQPLVKRRVHQWNISIVREAELIGYLLKALTKAVFRYYSNPLYAIYLARPALAYLYKSMRKNFR